MAGTKTAAPYSFAKKGVHLFMEKEYLDKRSTYLDRMSTRRDKLANSLFRTRHAGAIGES